MDSSEPETQAPSVFAEGEVTLKEDSCASKPGVSSDSDLQNLNAGSALKEIWGKWPGDESIDELLAALTP